MLIKKFKNKILLGGVKVSYIRDLVSIIIPTYNGNKFIQETLKNCLNQSYDKIEIIVVDDGSTSINMKKFLKCYIDEKKIKYIYQENSGLSSARNTGLKNASGEFIQFLDDDDLLDKYKIELQVKVLKEYHDIYGVYCKTLYFNTNTNKIIKELKVKPEKDHYKQLIEKNFFTVNSMLIRRPNITFDETLTSLEDYDFWLRLFKDKKIKYIEDTYCKVRVHGENMSANTERMAQNLIKVLEKVILDNKVNDSLKSIIKFRIYKMLFLISNDKRGINKKIYLDSNIYRGKAIIFEGKQYLKKYLNINKNIYLTNRK